MNLMCPCFSLFLALACKTAVIKVITSIILTDYTLQAFSTGCSEALVEVFCCPQLPQKPPVSLLIISVCESFLDEFQTMCEQGTFEVRVIL